jgi:hypothetical protein
MEASVFGEFWIDSADQIRLSGQYDVDRGVLTVRGGELVPCMQSVDRGTYTNTYLREDTDESYLIFGLLSDGEEVTLPDAARGGCRHVTGSTEQDFRLLYALVGGHITATERYSACSLHFSQWRWWLARASWTGVLDLPRYGPVRLTVGDGLTFSDLPSLSQDDVERFLVTPLRILLMLLSGRDAPPERLTLHRGKGRTVTVNRARRPTVENATAGPIEPVVPLDSIGLSGLSAWYGLTDHLVPVTSVIAKTLINPGNSVEAKTLSLAASAEATHRELYDERTMSPEAARRVRKAAVAAVPEDARERVGRMLQNLGQLTYAERLHLLVARLGEPLASEIAGSSVRRPGDTEEDPQVRTSRNLWVQSVKNARNGFAHAARNSPDDLKQYAGEMYVLYESLRWMLTGVLLQHIGVSQQAVFDGFKQSSSYDLFRERAVSSWPEIYAPAEPSGA